MTSHTANTAAISVLGGFAMQSWGDPVNIPVSVQRVLGFLAISGKWQTREVVAGQLWSFASQDRAQANLRTALW
jgi:DNA-binding SARP family transcriptional activator